MPPWYMPLSSPGAGCDFGDEFVPAFNEATVHDPSIFRAGADFYVIGSHMAMATSRDLVKWTQISNFVNAAHPFIDANDFAEAFAWSQSRTFWAGDIEPMPDGRFFLYYCNCQGSMPLGNIGLAISDGPAAPYRNQGIFLKSGMAGESHGGTRYDATVHPNCIDPHAFFDAVGDFWMVYGSFSGGIFILRMCPKTGLPLPGQGYGKKLCGGNHARIEGPYILYSPESGYYYLFLSFGGLGTEEGYNIRVARSRHVDGPYVDARGNDIIAAKGAPGSVFDDASIAPYGTKLMGGYWFMQERGEPGRNTTGHLSPGHNSAYYDASSGRYFLIFHQRFAHSRTIHRVRVHEMWLTGEGWFVVSPFRYEGAAGAHRPFEAAHMQGTWKLIPHGQSINYSCELSIATNFNEDGTIQGRHAAGKWALDADGATVRIILNEVTYTGRVLRCYNADVERWVMAFTAICAEGTALWGAGLAEV